jgi:hypothetical protein
VPSATPAAAAVPIETVESFAVPVPAACPAVVWIAPPVENADDVPAALPAPVPSAAVASAPVPVAVAVPEFGAIERLGSFAVPVPAAAPADGATPIVAPNAVPVAVATSAAAFVAAGASGARTGRRCWGCERCRKSAIAPS